MDCIKAREKIDLYVDDMLSEAERQRLNGHVSSCSQCWKALDDAIRLKRALGNLPEIEPPAGLVASAVRKAKKRRIPVYAYATAAAAAVVALAFAFSPQLMSNSKNNAGGEEKIMYSAADENVAPEEGFTMDSASVAEASEEAPMDAPQLQCTLGTGAPIASERTESAAITIYTDLYTFKTEADLTAAIKSNADSYGTAGYYRPKAVPEGALLQQIEVSDFSIRWIYSLTDGSMLTFEWLRTITADVIQSWSEQTQMFSDTLAHSFNHTGDVFWSSQARFNKDAQMEATDGTVINAYWLQDGVAFHMELPATFTEVEIMQYCMGEQVPIQ